MSARHSFLVIACLAATCLAAGCDLIGFEPPLTVSVQLGSDDPEVIERTRAVLEQRLADYPVHWNSSLRFETRPHQLLVTFLNGAPDRETIRRIVGTTGKLRVYPQEQRIDTWITERDIVRTEVHHTDRGPELAVVVTESAGRRLLDRTRRHVGAVVATEFDGKVVSTAVIRGVFSRQFVISGMKRDEVLTMRTTLAYGLLPTAVVAVDFVGDGAPPRR